MSRTHTWGCLIFTWRNMSCTMLLKRELIGGKLIYHFSFNQDDCCQQQIKTKVSEQLKSLSKFKTKLKTLSSLMNALLTIAILPLRESNYYRIAQKIAAILWCQYIF